MKITAEGRTFDVTQKPNSQGMLEVTDDMGTVLALIDTSTSKQSMHDATVWQDTIKDRAKVLINAIIKGE